MKFIFIFTLLVYPSLADQRVNNNVTQTQVLDRRLRASESSDKNNPCTYTVPVKPNFSAPGTRISEAKCYEYIWELKERQDNLERETKCSKWRRDQAGVHDVHFVIGGRAAEPGEFPHLGAVGWRAVVGTWIFKCGSSLISSKFLLTAAHCSQVSSRDASLADTVPEIVRLGYKNIVDVFTSGGNPQDAKIKRIIKHPNFNSPKKYFDIAIIEIVDAVVFTKFIQPACLWSKFDTKELGNKATTTGWGIVETAGMKTSPNLQAAVVDIINSETCDNLLKPHRSRLWGGLESHQLCAGKLTGGVDACQGDSGGPLQVQIPLPIKTQGSMHYVIGVTSFGIGCALPNLPGVYTRVSSFIDWIEDVVWRGL
ncbi:unnamed protein product [Leptosia nina]|uniref:Peptidase S1 domain-containing protein n=1 Tax=Leptosia nina TaxID=320188 RepID=A0AAV1J084_9NEOP